MKNQEDFPVTEEQIENSKCPPFFYRPLSAAHSFGEMGIVYPDDEAVEEECRWVEENQL